MRKFRVVIILVAMVLFVLFLRSVTAQDADGDTIKDEFDACPETPRESVLPIQGRANSEFFGCSCDQIYGKLGGSLVCYDIYCVPGGRFSLTKRLTTNEKIDCGPDYCLGDVLYDFAEPDFVQCIDGNVAEDFCKPKITRDSNDCISGLVPQKQIVPSFDIQITGEEVTDNEVVVNDYFSLLLDNPEVRSFLGNPSRSEFDSLVEKTSDSVTVSRFVSRKRVGNTEATIPFVTLTIKPISGIEIKNFAVIEILESSYNEDAFIFYNKQPAIIEPTKEFVWLFDSIGEEGIIINYQINEPVEAPAETIVIGKIKNRFFLADWWPLLLIPIIGYFAYRYIMSNKD